MTFHRRLFNFASATLLASSCMVANGQHAVTIKQSHGGAGKQARSIIDGLAGDTNALHDNGSWIPKDWQNA